MRVQEPSRNDLAPAAEGGNKMVYVSDFGEIKAVPSRFQRSRDVFVLQADKWALAYLRPFTTIELATTGDALQRELVVEYAIEARAPKANGAVYDIL